MIGTGEELRSIKSKGKSKNVLSENIILIYKLERNDADFSIASSSFDSSQKRGRKNGQKKMNRLISHVKI